MYMTLQSSGAISASQIQTELGGANPISLSEYYSGGAYTPAGAGPPSSGTISFSNFYGVSAQATGIANTAGKIGYIAHLGLKFRPTVSNFNEQSSVGVANSRIQEDIGTDWTIADWYDFGSLSNAQLSYLSVTTWAYGAGADMGMVTRSGNLTYSGSRKYFASFHNYNRPGFYAAHANYYSYYWSLGSWFGISMKYLCKSTAYMVLAGGGTSSGYNASFMRRAWNTGTNETTFGSLPSTTGGYGAGSTNWQVMMSSGYNGYGGHTDTAYKDLSRNSNAISWGNTNNVHYLGTASGNAEVCIFTGGWWNPSNAPGPTGNTRPISYKSYSSSTTSLTWGQMLTYGRRHVFNCSNGVDSSLAGAGDWSTARRSDTMRISHVTQNSVVGSGGLGEVMYVMQSAGNSTYAYITGNTGNYPYTPRNYVKRYTWSSGGMNTNFMALTVSGSGVSSSDFDDVVLHGAGTTSSYTWRKLSLSSSAAATTFGSTIFSSGDNGHGPG